MSRTEISLDRAPLWWLLGLGAASLLGQVLLLRELLVASLGSELVLLLGVGGLLLASAVGVLFKVKDLGSGEAVRALLLGLAALVPAGVVLARAVRLLLGAVPGAYLPLGQQFLGMGLVLLPFGLVSGLIFQRAAGLHVQGGGSLASAYAVESAGGLLGGIAASVLLGVGVANGQSAILGAGIAWLAAVVPGRSRPAWLAPAAIGLGLILAVGLIRSDRLDRALTGLSHPGLVATRDTPYGRVTVRQQDGQVTVFANDALLFDTEGTEAEEFVHLAALQVERPARVLLLGGSAEGLVTEVLDHGASEVVALELDAAFLETALPYLGAATRRALVDPRVRRVTDDPRAFLRRATAGTFDLILIALGEPESGQTSRFYSVEFLAECRRQLAPGGVVGFRLQGAENLRSPILRRRTASVWQAARRIFSEVLVLPGGRDLFLAADRPLVRDPEILSRRWQERQIPARLISPAYLAYRLTDDRLPRLEAELASSPPTANSDSRPICYALTQILWLSRFIPGLAVADTGTAERWLRWGTWVAAAVWLGVLLAARQRERWRRTCWAAVAGTCGMILEGALILGYQARQGALFRDLGILLTLFMAGLTLGVALLGRFGPPASRWTGIGLGLGLAGISGLSALVLSPAGPVSAVPYGVLLLATGLLTGGIFAHAARPEGADQAALVRPLYAADLLGGCLGSLVAGLVLLPLLGLPGTALLAAGLAASLLVLW